MSLNQKNLLSRFYGTGLAWVVWALASASGAPPAVVLDTTPLIVDIEALRNSLPMLDIQRRPLTLRLADLYFEASSIKHQQLNQSPNPTADERAELERCQRRAVALYEAVLLGEDGFPLPSGAQKYNIQFQLARLYADSGMAGRAHALWTELVNQNDLTRLKLEAALRLAEAAEAKKNQAGAPQASSFYDLAIQHCSGSDLCSYVHYRRAWLLKNQNRLDAAITEMQLALFDSKNQVREEALRDFIVFLAAQSSDGKKALVLIEALAEKLARPLLLSDLASAFFSAGNRKAGTRVLGYINARDPHLKHLLRLMEETYAVRDWDKFRAFAETAAQHVVGSLDPGDLIEGEKSLRRLTVQLDGERISQPALAGDFCRTVDLYLQLFPSSPERGKMVAGWLAAQIDPVKKTEKIKAWLVNSEFQWLENEQVTLQEFLVASSRRAHDQAVLIHSLVALIELAGKQQPGKEVEYRYSLGVAYYDDKKFQEARSMLEPLANPESDVVSSIVMKSRNVVLDILAQEKNYGAIVEIVGRWTAGTPQPAPSAANGGNSTSDLSEGEWLKSLSNWQRVREHAQFEVAVSLGQTAPALADFTTFCLAGKYRPQSCQNARVLAITLKDQPKIFSILTALGEEEALAQEYEAAGFFVSAAEILEKRLAKNNQGLTPYLKTALLYELGSDTKGRNRLLTKARTAIALGKSAETEQVLLLQMLKEAGLVNVATLDGFHEQARKNEIANWLEERGLGTGKTKKILLACPTYVGEGWSRQVLAEIDDLDKAQRKISFYGRSSQRRFENRLAKIKIMNAAADRYLGGADAKTRRAMAQRLEKSHRDLVAEILSTPVPQGLDEAAVAEVQGALGKIAEPFAQRAEEYQALYAAAAPATSEIVTESLPPLPAQIFEQALSELHRDPSALSALRDIQKYYESNGRSRLASYFQGRVEQRQQSEKKL